MIYSEDNFFSDWRVQGEGLTPDQTEGGITSCALLHSLNSTDITAESTGITPDPTARELALFAGFQALNIQSFHF